MTAAVAGHLPWVGCVVGHELGVLTVLTDRGEIRASYGARMLGALARDRAGAPEPGEWVRLRSWPDGPVTVEGIAYRPEPRHGLASVVPLRRRRTPRAG